SSTAWPCPSTTAWSDTSPTSKRSWWGNSMDAFYTPPPMRLGVNIDHVATLRQARRGRYPDPVHAATLAELAGAEQITLHVREDRRHVNDRDLEELRKTVQGTLNLEMAAHDAMVQLALAQRPDTATLVPERREELTTEGGLDVVGHRENVERVTHA